MAKKYLIISERGQTILWLVSILSSFILGVWMGVLM